MFPKRNANRAQGAKVGRLRLLVYALIAFIAYAPLAKAACEIEHLALLAQANAQVQAQMPDETRAADQSPVDDQDPCCADDSASAMTQTRAAPVDGALLLAAEFHPTASVIVSVPPSVRPANPAYLQHRSPPPEPVFRRVPKLRF